MKYEKLSISKEQLDKACMKAYFAEFNSCSAVRQYTIAKKLYLQLFIHRNISLENFPSDNECYRRISEKNQRITYTNHLTTFVELCERQLQPDNQSETTTVANSNQLFKIKDSNPEQYVVRVGTNSENKPVVEDKATGIIFSTDLDKLEKVVPYSIGIKFFSGPTVYHYRAEPGQVKLNDLLFAKNGSSSPFAVVVEIDTKNEKADTLVQESFSHILQTKAL